MSNDMNRREMLRHTALGGAATALGIHASRGKPAVAAPAKLVHPVNVRGPGHVVRVHTPGLKQGFFPDPRAARAAVDKAVMTLAGEDDPGRAWLRFITPQDRVGIKINCLGTRMVSSMKEVVWAVADGIREAGVKDENIVIIDMFASNMMGGRYNQQHNKSKMRVFAHKEGTYQKSWVNAGPSRARFADVFLWTTAVINIPVIKDHDLAGVTCCMKNMTFGVVEKPHINHHIVNEAIAHLWALDEIRSRVRLNLIDGSSILYDGGPKYNRKALITHDSIYATTDPVAMDALAFELIEAKRAANGYKTLKDVGRSPDFLNLASEMGLGIADREKIALQTVNLPPVVPAATT